MIAGTSLGLPLSNETVCADLRHRRVPSQIPQAVKLHGIYRSRVPATEKRACQHDEAHSKDVNNENTLALIIGVDVFLGPENTSTLLVPVSFP